MLFYGVPLSGLGLLRGAGQAVAAHREVHKQIQVAAIQHKERQPGDVTHCNWAVSIELEVAAPERDCDAKHHLEDLQRGDHGCPQRTEGQVPRVVSIHDGMHGVVHGSKKEPCRSAGGEAIPANHEHSDVVVPVQEKQGLLPQNNEHGVDELRELGKGKDDHPKR